MLPVESDPEAILVAVRVRGGRHGGGHSLRGVRRRRLKAQHGTCERIAVKVRLVVVNPKGPPFQGVAGPGDISEWRTTTV